jgi:glycosyltransferase involved in cell wall biosynthesis
VRVLHLIESLEFGGAEKVVVTLANATAREHEVSVCCVRRRGDLAAELAPTVDVRCLERPEGNDWSLPRRLAALFRASRCDVVHSHNWSLFIETALGGGMAHVPALVHTIHGPYLDHGPGRTAALKRAVRHLLERRLAPRFRSIAAVSRAIARYAVEEVGLRPGQVTTVHNGIADGVAPAPERREAGRPVTFIATGRLAPVKNHPLLLRAFAHVARELPETRLLLVGDGPQRAEIERLVDQLGVRGAVSLLGFRSDVGRLLASADAYVLSSRYEGISMALLEAMQSGLPAVATRVGGIPETVVDGETGLLVAPDDEPALRQAMLRLARDPDLRLALGSRARELQAREFSLAATTRRYLELYGAAGGVEDAA